MSINTAAMKSRRACGRWRHGASRESDQLNQWRCINYSFLPSREVLLALARYFSRRFGHVFCLFQIALALKLSRRLSALLLQLRYSDDVFRVAILTMPSRAHERLIDW